MLKSKLITATIKTTANILLIGGLGLWSSGLSAQTVPIPKDTTEHLEATVVRNQTNLADGVAELETNSRLEPKINGLSQWYRAKSTGRYSGSVDIIIDDFRADWELRSASQDWFNLNRGDGSKELVRVIIWRF